MHPMLNIAVRTLRKAGQVMVQAYEQQSQLAWSSVVDPKEILPIERTITQLIISGIQRSYPQHKIIASTGERLEGVEAENVQWVVEPLAGRINFTHQLPHCAQAIAILVKASPEFLAIYDPLRNELFTASRGVGVQLNGYRLRIPAYSQSLRGKLLATPLSEHEESLQATTLAQLTKLLRQGALVRCSGCSLLDLAYVAAGRLDGFWANGLPDWMAAAGALLISEAGGLVTDGSGSPHWTGAKEMVAAPAKLLKPLLQQLRAS